MPSAPKRTPLKPRYQRPPRGTTAERGYGSEHEKLRARLLVEHPICQRCTDAWSVDLHHVDRNPFNRDPSNCLMICERCHHAEHGR
ncbi:MAG: HNH endonuclease signature motif containing protein [Ardenticatenales bacterium]